MRWRCRCPAVIAARDADALCEMSDAYEIALKTNYGRI